MLHCAALGDFTEMISRAFGKAMAALHRRGSAPQLDVSVLSDPAVRSLIDTHAAALDTAIQKAPMSDSMRRALSDSNFIFSGIKVFHELHEAFPSLVDSNGDLKPFEQFLNDVQSIDQTYNRNYLRAEYNFAVAAAQGAGQWERIEADGDRYDLQYRATLDERTRPEHQALHGVTLPPSHPFWQEFYPPNGWNCRCRAVQVRKDKYVNTDPDVAVERGNEALARDKKGIFRFNPGQQHKTFPDYNPYTIRRCRDCDVASGKATLTRLTPPDNELCQACRFIRTCAELRSETIKIGTGSIEINNLVNRSDSDFDRLMDVARHFAKMGETVVITPKMSRPAQFEYDCAYVSLKGTQYYGKCPDLLIGDKWYEHEGFTTDNPKRAFSNMMNHGLKQSSRIIIDLPPLTERFMLRGIYNRIMQAIYIEEVWLRNVDGSLSLLYKKTDG